MPESWNEQREIVLKAMNRVPQPERDAVNKENGLRDTYIKRHGTKPPPTRPRPNVTPGGKERE